jgi:CRISPR-associated DxTHG motif protein
MSKKQTVLISTIGKPRSGSYDLAKYRFGENVEETDFFFLPLLKHYKPAQLYLLGTKDSIWQKVDEAKNLDSFDYNKVIIPFGTSTEEIWEIFEKIVNLPLNNVNIIIDITHGFRAIPFAVFLATLYFQAVRDDVKVIDILYGNYEAKDKKTGIAPVVHLDAFVEMNEWIRAASRFTRYGDGDLLIQKLEPYNTYGQLTEFLKRFRILVDNLMLNYVSQITPSAKKLSDVSKKSRIALREVAPFRLLEGPIRDRLNILLKEEPEWKKEWRVAEWFFSSRKYSQAVIVLREIFYTYICERLGMKIWNSRVREKEAGEIIYLLQIGVEKIRKQLNASPSQAQLDLLKKIEKTIGSTLMKKWAYLLFEVSDARNRVGHALMRGGGGSKRAPDPGEQIKMLGSWLKYTNEILSEIDKLPRQSRNELFEYLNLLRTPSFPRLYLIVNEGVHPIVEDLKKQYGADIRYEVVTRGNVSLDEEAQIARRVKEIVEANHGAEFVIVPSGLPYIVTVVYNTVLQITSKHPVYLQLDREKGRYIEKTLDPRKLMF